MTSDVHQACWQYSLNYGLTATVPCSSTSPTSGEPATWLQLAYGWHVLLSAADFAAGAPSALEMLQSRFSEPRMQTGASPCVVWQSLPACAVEYVLKDPSHAASQVRSACANPWRLVWWREE
jgi:hypothetical protein